MKATPKIAMMSQPVSPGYFQVAFVHILQQEESYRDEESLINRALQIAIQPHLQHLGLDRNVGRVGLRAR